MNQEQGMANAKTDNKNKPDGFALVTVIVFIFLIMALIICLNKRMGMLYSVSEHEIHNEQAQDGKYIALARALSLLQTGLPPASPSSYSVKLIERTGAPEYAVTYKNESIDSWSVEVSPLSQPLPPLPETFGGA